MIIVIGATGPVGRSAITLLREAGHGVAAVTRRPGSALLPEGVRVIGADPSEPGALDAHWEGVAGVLLSPRAAGPEAANLLRTAAARGVRRVAVISSATVVHPAGEPRFAEGFKAAERAAEDSGLEWTHLRCSDFATNALAWAPQVPSGAVRGAYAKAASSTIHERDIAAVAVKALTESGHGGRAYVLTGPESLTQTRKAQLIGEAIGRDLAYVELAPEQVRAAMLAQGLPEEIPARLLGSLADFAREAGPSTGTVERLLGRPALTFGQWAVEYAAAFRS
ncbi:NAD(P)H-binding protein [Glycomyces luteolus]|uniref:NAD(P)H-binding protein n=1 Tax=Glycomyces luteolus TaxID=2670330 RepID=A0A9X3STG4_9ACTN|nr:NAD(P)H-binding protein [Glycomyces luteolus]MDA1362204.1 NAD(P)H-binding protein [Glycomyces luteolus]